MGRGAQTRAGLVTSQGTALKDCAHGRDILGQLVQNCCLWEGHTLEEFVENYVPLEQRKSVKTKGPAEKIGAELTAAPLFHPLAQLRGRKQRKWRAKLRKKGGERGRYFKDLILFLKLLL